MFYQTCLTCICFHSGLTWEASPQDMTYGFLKSFECTRYQKWAFRELTLIRGTAHGWGLWVPSCDLPKGWRSHTARTQRVPCLCSCAGHVCWMSWSTGNSSPHCFLAFLVSLISPHSPISKSSLPHTVFLRISAAIKIPLHQHINVHFHPV